jgi:uncharacterized protein (TIGR02300 family)
VAKQELGTKRTCPSCGTKYYDLHRDPIVCPSCATVFVIAAPARPEPAAVAAMPEKTEPTVEVKREEGVVSLEDAEADSDADVGPDADNEEDEANIPDVEVDEEVEEGDDDTFLEEEEEEGDVSGLLDVEAEDEEDT